MHRARMAWSWLVRHLSWDTFLLVLSVWLLLFSALATFAGDTTAGAAYLAVAMCLDLRRHVDRKPQPLQYLHIDPPSPEELQRFAEQFQQSMRQPRIHRVDLPKPPSGPGGVGFAPAWPLRSGHVAPSRPFELPKVPAGPGQGAKLPDPPCGCPTAPGITCLLRRTGAINGDQRAFVHVCGGVAEVPGPEPGTATQPPCAPGGDGT